MARPARSTQASLLQKRKTANTLAVLAGFTELIDSLSTNLTSFYRESSHFDYLRETYLPKLAERKTKLGKKAIRAWSSACSSGEEPYTLGITLLEEFGTDNGWDVRILATDLRPHRDELVISTKAGYDMWAGPYGEWGSRKQLLASLDQSLKRMGLDYVDIFYSHRFDPETPLEETLGALDTAVRQGKALYAGISSYSAKTTEAAAQIMAGLGTPILIHQPSYSMLNRWIEGGLLDVLDDRGIGCIVFSPLAQGLLSSKYLEGVPEGSRARRRGSLTPEMLAETTLAKIRGLHQLAAGRGQSLAQMALAWVLRDPRVTSALIGVSSVAQLEENLAALDRLDFASEELEAIDRLATESGINLWAASSQV